MGNLKPCPFCGGEDVTYYVGDDGYIQCATCLGTMPFRYGVPHDEGKAKATATWNTRANEDRTIVLPVPIGGKVYVPHRYTVIEGDKELYATCVGNCRNVDIETGQVFITREAAEKWLQDNQGKEV